MKNLSNSDCKRIVSLAEEINTARAALTTAVETANAAIEHAQTALAAYETSIDNAHSFAEDIVREIESYMDERSEKWHEGNSGEAYAQWKSAWEEFLGNRLQPDEIVPIIIEDDDQATALLELPSSPDR